MRVPALCVVVGVIVGCGGELRLGPEARLTCDADADCPAPMTCVEEARRCVLPGVVLDVTPPLFLSATASAERMGRSGAVTITLTFDEGITSAVLAVEQDGAVARPLSAVTIDGSVVTGVVDGATLVSGPLVLTVTVENAAGLSLSTRVPTGVTVDVDAPDVVVDDVAIEAGAGNPLFPGRTSAARVDSTATVAVTWSEPISATGATDVVLTDTAGATATLTVAPVTSGARSTLAIAPADFAALADGDIAISLTVVDDVGNSAVRTLPTPLVKDTTPPAAPTFTRLRRTPFGDDTAAVLTEANGTASDAVVVLAVPTGVTVGPLLVPAHVARIVPASDGALTLAVEIDVPAMRLVAVDAAGNLGAPASAQTTDLVASTAIGASPHQVLARPAVADSLQQRGDVRIDNVLREGGAAGVTTTSSPFWRPLTTLDTVQVNGRVLMARDPIAGGVIVVGNGETFRLRGSNLERLNVPTLVVQRGSAMATDERRGRIVLFGGAQPTETPSGVVRNDLFEWDGARWIHVLQHNPAATDRPSPRIGHGAGYVASLGGVVVVNGCGEDDLGFLGCATPLPPEVWVWDGASFTRRCAGAACGDAPFSIRPEVTVDTDGAMVVTGGTSDSGLIAIGPEPPPALKRFVDDTFVGRCGGDCARAIPFDGLAHFDDDASAPAFLGTCGAAVCLVTVRADDTTTTVTLESGRTLPAIGNDLQARGFVVDGGRLLVSELAFPGNRILTATGGQFGQAFPANLTPRCGGAVAVVDDEPRLVGGCALCTLGPAAGQCSGPVSAMEAPLSALLARGTGPVSGNTIAAPGVDDTTIVSWQLVGNAASMDVRRASDLAAVQTFALGDKRYVAAAVSPGINDDVVIVTAVSDVVQFPPAFFIVEQNQILDMSGATAVLDAGCTSNCGLNRSTGSGVTVAPTRGGKAVLFGGTTGGLVDVGDATVVMDALGQGTSLNPAVRPFPRQWAMAAYDPEREVTWLTGGTTAGEVITGLGTQCAGPGSPSECSDVWTFDGDTWTEIRPVNVLGVGLPPPRYRGQVAVVDGRVLMTGGNAGTDFNTRAVNDAWVLESSTLTPPAHQLSASLAAYGSDADQTFIGLLARWCGAARDGTGAAVPVTLRAFAGGAWRTMDSTIDANGCVDGELDVDGLADVVVREPGHTIVVEVVPVLQTPGRDAPRLTTTVLTLTGRYSAP